MGTGSGRETERLGFRLLVGAVGTAPAPLELDAPADATVGAAAEAFAHTLGISNGEVFLERTASWLPRERPLSAVGLRHGDRLLLAADRSSSRSEAAVEDARLELAVVGGPSSGRRFPLAAGEHVLGREPGCDIVLDDPALSSRHVRLSVGADGGVTATDLRSRNGSRLNGAAIEPESPVAVPSGAVLRVGRTLLAVEEPRLLGTAARPTPDGTIAFNRPPRVRRPREAVVRPFPPPPETAQRGRLPLGASLVPLALGLGLYFVTGYPTMLFFAALSPVMALSTYVEDRRSGRKGFERRRREYRAELARLRDELEEERRRELRARREAAPSAAELLARARGLDPALWERRPGDSDFLHLRLGTADRPALLGVRIEPGGDSSVRKEAEEVAAWYATAADVPVELPLDEIGAVGLCGPRERVDALGRWLVGQAAALHSPRELMIAAALGDGRAPEWEWLLWLPHAGGGGPLADGLVTGPVAARRLVEEGLRLVEERQEQADVRFGSSRLTSPAVLLVLDEAVAPERPLVSELLGKAAGAGVGVIWLGSARRDLPGECAGIVELDEGSPRLTYTDARSGETIGDVSADGLAADLAERLALALAPVCDTSAGRDSAIPDRISLFELLGVEDAEVDWIVRRWCDREDGLAARIGAATDGMFTVDLRADGPHGLVAGMTGAGKSELLQTLIASLAAAHPPDRLSFLLIDYKGGAAFKECMRLPHTVGVVTDLDSHLTQRALASLNAELQRRERLLRDAGAKDLPDLERRDAASAPPSLVIVIDEFATLAKEVPEFIDGVVDVAQRGRSLGVHLVLATQRPGGVVSENIRANTNLRIALRVNEAAESTDVIGVPEAARIPRERPGRAYARTGHGELTEFQTAYGGGRTAMRTDDRSIRVRALGFGSGERAVHGEDGEGGETDLQRLVEATAAAADTLALPDPSSPWLPPLEPLLALDSLAEPSEPAREAVVGLLDEPAAQRQEVFRIDFEVEGSILVYGASGSGKTTFLRTLALSLASDAGPDDVQVFGLDFATRGLAILEDLPHCGSVISGEDEERTARLFGFLRATLDRRRALFAEHGVFTLSELRRRGIDESVPRIVVLLDNYSGFVAAFERVNLGELVDALPRLVGDGRPLGVHFAISADRRGAVPNTLAGIIPAKIVLRMADDDEFTSLGVPARSIRAAHLPPGRGFLPGGTELQVAIAGGDSSASGQAAAIAELAARTRSRHPGRLAPTIDPLPTLVEARMLPPAREPLQAVLGIGDVDLAPVTVDLSDRHFLVLGPYRSGRSTALRRLLESLRAGTAGAELHLLAPRRTPLTSLGVWASAAEGMQASEDAAIRLAFELERRTAGARPLIVVVDDGEELAESVAAPQLETIVRRGRDLDVRVLCACERQAAQRAFGGWLRELRKEEHGLLLAPDADVDGDLLGVRLPRRTNPVFPPGRGYLVERGTIELVQVAGEPA
jgi:S-DNA-T family DNA segregation ATPase FtsK/SpoIIIE